MVKRPAGSAYSQADLHEVVAMGQAVTFFLHHCRDIPKAPLVWASGLLALVLVFAFSQTRHPQQVQCRGSFVSGLISKLNQLGVHPSTYRWDLFEQSQCLVYLKFRVEWRQFLNISTYRQPFPLFYVGSTSIGMAKREFRVQSHGGVPTFSSY